MFSRNRVLEGPRLNLLLICSPFLIDLGVILGCKSDEIQTNADEAKKMDNLAKELVENYLRASRKSFLDMGYCFYVFLFRVLQRMILLIHTQLEN